MHNCDNLVVGALPPPFGGVTVYCERLKISLEQEDSNICFIDYKQKSFIYLLRKIVMCKKVHLHISKSYVRFFLVVFSIFLGKKILFTFHGDIGRYSRLANLLDKLSISLCNTPVFINRRSFELGKLLNKESRFTSSFIKPQSIGEVNDRDLKKLTLWKKSYKNIFCTNASCLSFDKNKVEIYGIFDLIRLFEGCNDIGLIICDPSGEYRFTIENERIFIPTNVLIFSSYIDFNAVLLKSNGMIRNTTTDGDSISVKECLSLGKQVYATNVVERPKEVNLVENLSDLKIQLLNFNSKKKIVFSEDGFEMIKDLYIE